MIPGSHRREVPHVASTGTGRFAQMAEPDYVDETAKVTMELEPGQCFLFDRWLLHGSPANESNRRAQVIRGEDRFGLNRIVPAP